jgi:hypothetical protein
MDNAATGYFNMNYLTPDGLDVWCDGRFSQLKSTFSLKTRSAFPASRR